MQYFSVQEALDRAVALWDDPKAEDEVEKLCQFALDHETSNPQILYLYGTRCVERGKPGLGSVLLTASIEANPSASPAWNNLGIAFRKLGNHKRARTCFLKALELAGGEDTSAINNIATNYNDQGEYKKAVEWWDFCLEIDPNHYDAQFNRAMALLALERFGEGWDAYDQGHLASGSAAKTRGWRSYAQSGEPEHPYWDGKDVNCLVVWGEQGVGDEVMFASCLADAKRHAKHIVFDCHKRLYPIFKRSFPDMLIFPTREEKEFKWGWPKGFPPIEARTAIGSLPRLFRRKAEDFPKHDGYLKADPEMVERYRDPSKLRIGFATVGGTRETGMERRSLDHSAWGTLFALPGIQWVSLDYKKDSRLRADWAREHFKADIVHDQEMIDDLDKQFACIAGLDLIVTVTMSVCDFAGALGKECWTLTPEPAGWRFGVDREDRLFYPSARLFRQKTPGDWQPVLERVAAELKTRFNR